MLAPSWALFFSVYWPKCFKKADRCGAAADVVESRLA